MLSGWEMLEDISLEFLHLLGPLEGSFVPLAKGIEALRKLRRAFLRQGVSISPLKTPYSPPSQGEQRSQTKGLAFVIPAKAGMTLEMLVDISG